MTKSSTSPNRLHPKNFYHICFAVPDLEAAMKELSELLGVTFGEPVASQLGPWPYTIAFTDEPPHIELICGGPGSPWETNEPQFHHLGWWTSDLPGQIDSWTRDGGSLQFDGRDHGRSFAYINAPHSGAGLELVDATQHEDFRRRWCR